MEHYSAVLLRRLNPYCARALEGAASLCQNLAHAEITPDHWLLKSLDQGEGDLPVLSQQLLSHIAAKQKPSSLQLTWDDEKGIVLAFDERAEGDPS